MACRAADGRRDAVRFSSVTGCPCHETLLVAGERDTAADLTPYRCPAEAWACQSAELPSDLAGVSQGQRYTPPGKAEVLG